MWGQTRQEVSQYEVDTSRINYELIISLLEVWTN